jgi:hypothetical protein
MVSDVTYSSHNLALKYSKKNSKLLDLNSAAWNFPSEWAELGRSLISITKNPYPYNIIKYGARCKLDVPQAKQNYIEKKWTVTACLYGDETRMWFVMHSKEQLWPNLRYVFSALVMTQLEWTN